MRRVSCEQLPYGWMDIEYKLLCAVSRSLPVVDRSMLSRGDFELVETVTAFADEYFYFLLLCSAKVSLPAINITFTSLLARVPVFIVAGLVRADNKHMR